MMYLEPETSIYKWLFQLDDSKSWHRKWLFGVPKEIFCGSKFQKTTSRFKKKAAHLPPPSFFLGGSEIEHLCAYVYIIFYVYIWIYFPVDLKWTEARSSAVALDKLPAWPGQVSAWNLRDRWMSWMGDPNKPSWIQPGDFFMKFA